MNDKPREWVVPLKTLIINDGKGLSAWLRQDREDETHVIEYCAYKRMEQERDEARAGREAATCFGETQSAALSAERTKSAKLVEALRRFNSLYYRLGTATLQDQNELNYLYSETRGLVDDSHALKQEGESK